MTFTRSIRRRPPGRATGPVVPLPQVAENGGRAAAGRAADAGDRVAHSITVATVRRYETVFVDLAALAAGKTALQKVGILFWLPEDEIPDRGDPRPDRRPGQVEIVPTGQEAPVQRPAEAGE